MSDEHVRRPRGRSDAASHPPAAAGDSGRGRAGGDGDPARQLDGDTRRDPLMQWLVAAAAACIAGCALLLAVAPSRIATAVAIVLGGTAFVLLVSAAFYVIGRSEDRDRAARRGGDGAPPAS